MAKTQTKTRTRTRLIKSSIPSKKNGGRPVGALTKSGWRKKIGTPHKATLKRKCHELFKKTKSDVAVFIRDHGKTRISCYRNQEDFPFTLPRSVRNVTDVQGPDDFTSMTEMFESDEDDGAIDDSESESSDEEEIKVVKSRPMSQTRPQLSHVNTAFASFSSSTANVNHGDMTRQEVKYICNSPAFSYASSLSIFGTPVSPSPGAIVPFQVPLIPTSPLAFTSHNVEPFQAPPTPTSPLVFNPPTTPRFVPPTPQLPTSPLTMVPFHASLVSPFTFRAPLTLSSQDTAKVQKTSKHGWTSSLWL